MEQLALKLRREWGIDNYAPIDIFSLALEKIENLTLKWYEMDGIVSGCCLRSEDDNLILINSRHSKGRQNFTLAHELYHLNFDESSDTRICKLDSKDEIEDKANKFASYFLMPKCALEDYYYRNGIKEWTLKDMVKCEQLFQISHKAMITRLHEEKYLNDSLDLNTYNNNFKNDNYVESDEISEIYKLYFISPKELAQKDTEAIQNMKNNEIVEKKEENSEKNEQKNNSPIILVDKNCIPSEEIIDRKGKNNKKKNKKRYTEKTEKTACSSEINEEPQNQLNKENEKVSELNEINKEENNVQLIIVDKKEESKISNNNDNINVSNNNDNSEMDDISHIQANNIESNGINIINNTNAPNNNENSEVNDIDRIQTNNIALNRINEENNFNIIINSDNHDTDTNSNKYKNLIDKKRKRGNELINELNEYNPDKILRKIRTT